MNLISSLVDKEQALVDTIANNLPFLPKVPTDTGKPSPQGTANANQLSVQDIIAPLEIEVDFNQIRINNRLFRSFFVSTYPRYIEPNWLEPLVDFDHSLEIAMFIYPTSSKTVLDDLRRKIAEMEATIQTDIENNRPINPSVQIALDDAQALQEQLAKGAERFFNFGLYISVPATTKEDLNNTSKLVESTLGSISITARRTSLQMEDAFLSTMPLGVDLLKLNHNMDTTSLATTFPFTTSELTANEGLIYGINEHNGSLIIFDRFTLENANEVIFAKSGAGKSYFVKLEALRSLMFGTQIIIIDPEQEYKKLADSVGGEYINFSSGSPVKINPFDLAGIATPGENELGRKILSLTGFLKLVLGELDPSQAAILDRAIVSTYRLKGITQDPASQTLEPPLMEDLYKVLLGMEDPRAQELSFRLERFIKGSLAGIFSAPSNINLNNQLIVFSIRELADQLRPLAMYLILDYIWTQIRQTQQKRILIVDEAWYMMKNEDSASFLVEICKRARKYYLGVSTITQDVEDFLTTDRGKEIITNSSIQVLMKQSPAAIDQVAKVFNLSEGERRLLLSSGVGFGLFFAGPSHVAIRVISSEEEHSLITTNPVELAKKG